MASNSLEAQLLNEPVRHLDLSDYCTVSPESTVKATIEEMQRTQKHTAFVTNAKTKLIGIITDRDVMRKVVNHKELWSQPITTVMTQNPDALHGTATTGEAIRLMDENRYRNVPVINDSGTPIGNVTYFAILSYLSEHFPEAVLNQPPNPLNFASQRDGG